MYIYSGLCDICELKIGMILCGVPYMLNWNLWRLQYSPDFSATMILLSFVMYLHCFRVANLPTITRPWQFVVEMVLLYLCSQFFMGMIWDPIGHQLKILEGHYIAHPVAINVYQNHPGLLSQVKLNILYIVKSIISLIFTIFTVNWTRSLDYLLPWRLGYHYFVKNRPDLKTQIARRHSWSSPREEGM